MTVFTAVGNHTTDVYPRADGSVRWALLNRVDLFPCTSIEPN